MWPKNQYNNLQQFPIIGGRPILNVCGVIVGFLACTRGLLIRQFLAVFTTVSLCACHGILRLATLNLQRWHVTSVLAFCLTWLSTMATLGPGTCQDACFRLQLLLMPPPPLPQQQQWLPPPSVIAAATAASNATAAAAVAAPQLLLQLG